MKVLLILLLSFGVLSANARVCKNSFQDITIDCIKSQDSKFAELITQEEERAKKLESAKKNNLEGKIIKDAEIRKNMIFPFNNENIKKNKDRVFFYQTASGNYGKFIIRTISKAKNQCSMYLDAVTFQGDRTTVEKNLTLSIETIAGSWSVDRASLDEVGNTDFVLKREYGICVLKRVNGYVFPYKKFIVEEDESNWELYWAGLFLLGLSIFLVARTVFQDDERYKAQEKLEDAEVDEKRDTPNDIVLKYSRPFFKRYFTPIIMGMRYRKRIREKYKRTLASSGMNKYLTPEDFFAFKLFLIIGFPIVYLFLRTFLEMEGDLPLSATPAVSIFGFVYPDIWIKGKIAQRREQIITSMPFIVDMLALSVEAGLDFVAAMQRVIEKAPPSPLVDEFEIMIKETKIGLSRAEGLRQLSWRVDTLPMSSFCATLISADAVGADIAPILKTLAQEIREKRSSIAEQKGAQAATKILLPMIFLVLPSVLLIIAAPMVMKLMGGD